MSIGRRSARERIADRYFRPAYGPPAPYPFQRKPERPLMGDLREPGPGRNPKFLEQFGDRTDYQKFRPGRSLPGYDPRKVNPHLMKGLGHLGLGAVMNHPWGRAARIAFNLAYALDWDNPVSWITEPTQTSIEDELGAAGFTKCCDNGQQPIELYGHMSTNYCAPASTALCPGIQSCGTSFQIPTGPVAGGFTFPAWSGTCTGSTPRMGYQEVAIGPAHQDGTRYSQAQVWRRVFPTRTGGVHIPQPAITIEPKDIPGIASPLPNLAPPEPHFQEWDTPLPRTHPRHVVPRNTRPFQIPMVQVDLTWPGGSSGGGGASGRWDIPAPKTDVRPKPNVDMDDDFDWDDETDYEESPSQEMDDDNQPDLIVNPGGGMHIPPRTGLHVHMPPPPDTKEGKHDTDAATARKLLYALYDKTTEFAEIVNIIYDTIPKDKRCPGARSISQKMACIYDNFEHVNISDSVAGIIRNHFEDKYVWGPFYSRMSDRRVPFGVGLSHPARPSNFEMSVRYPRR